MGYYDEEHRNNRPQKGSITKIFLMGLFGALLGGVLVIFASNIGLLPGGLTDTNKEARDAGKSTVDQTVNVDVNSAITGAVEKAQNTVVEVVSIKESSLFEQGGQSGVGSGVIYKKTNGKAFVVTNHHVVAQAGQLEVALSDGTKLKAKLLGSDPIMDLAVLQVDGAKVKNIAEFGSSSKLKSGEPVIAIGNPLGNFPGTVTKGIISAADRTIPVDPNQDGQADWHAEVIQTDAAINPGNSGGALINIQGQVIGINSMKIAQQAVEGIGFSIPSNIAKPIISDLEKYGKVKRPFMGVAIVPLTQVSSYHRKQTLKIPLNVTQGVVVTKVDPNSPAGKVGLTEFDVIVELDGKKVDTPATLRKQLYGKEIGEKMDVSYYHEGKKKTATITLVEEKN